MLTRSQPRDAGALITRAIPVEASTWDPDALTVSIVLSTGAAVERQDRRGSFDEVLDLAGAVIPDRLPLLDSHNRFELDGRLGEVTDIRREGGRIVGTARLSRHSPLAQRIAAEIGDGARFGVSIGYDVPPGRWTERTNPATNRREKVATAFTILEASLVAIPADPAATTRNIPMDPEDVLDNPTLPTPAPQTRAQINAEVRAAALAEMQARSAPAAGIRATVRVGEDHTDPVAIRTAMAGALAHRLAPGRCTLEGRAVEFRSHAILDMVGDMAVARGERVNLRDRDGLLERAVGAHSTSDFPLLLAEATNRALLAQYQAAAPTYRRWAARRTFNDFRDHNFLRIGDFPSFKEIGENGEVKYGTLSENRERVRVKEYNTGIIVGRRLLINDDLSALSDFSSMIAVRSASDENKLVYGLLGTAVMSDTKALFHADHGNLALTPSAIDAANVGLAVAALRKQTSLDGLTLNLSPAFLIVGPDKEMQGRQLLAAIAPAKTGDVNPWAGLAELVVDANITGNAWYLGCAPEAAPTIVYGYLSGAEGPQVRTEIDFETRAVKVAAGLDFGCGAIDFRGLHKNAGA